MVKNDKLYAHVKIPRVLRSKILANSSWGYRSVSEFVTCTVRTKLQYLDNPEAFIAYLKSH